MRATKSPRAYRLQRFHPAIVGEWCFSIPVVCDDGVIRIVAIEEYVEGFKAIRTEEDGNKITNRTCYPTSSKAINAAASWAHESEEAK